MNLTTMLDNWTKATSDAKWGVQRVFHDVFKAAEADQTTLIYGADYRDGNPCLVNTVGSMLTTGGGHGVPMANFSEIVSLFDRINREFEVQGINDEPGYVSPLAAEIFLRNFGDLKEAPPVGTDITSEQYVEPTDQELSEEMIRAFLEEPACEVDIDVLESSDSDLSDVGSEVPD